MKRWALLIRNQQNEDTHMVAKKGHSIPNILTEVIELTPELAEEFLKKNLGNRKLDQNLGLHYGTKMEEGRWEAGVAEISFDENGRLINGQHVCTGVILSGCTIVVRVVRNLPKKAFAVYDTGRRRTGNQSLKLAGYDLGTFGEAFMKMYYCWKHYPGDTPMEGFENLRSRGKARANKKRVKFSNELMIEMAAELEGELHAYFSKELVKDIRLAGGAASGVFAYWLFDQLKPRKAKEFFDKFLGYKGCEVNCPTRALRNALNSSGSGRLSIYERLYLFLVAWNAFCNNETRRTIQRPRRDSKTNRILVEELPTPVGL